MAQGFANQPDIPNASDSQAGIIEIATQAEQETGTATDKAVTSGRQQYHPSAAKGWAHYTTITTTTLQGSYNVSSLTDNGTGSTNINWDTDFSNVSYGIGAATGSGSLDWTVDSYSVGAVRMRTYDTSITATDCADVCVVAFGDQ